MGVGDLVVGKRMRKLGEAFYGRTRALEEALQGSDRAALDEAMARTVLEDGGDRAQAPGLADYVVRAHAWLAGQGTEALVQGQVSWPEVMS